MVDQLRVGTVVKFEGDTRPEIILDIYDDEVFHTIDHQGTVMQYGILDCSFEIVGYLDINPELTSLTNKLVKFNQANGYPKFHPFSQMDLNNILGHAI